ncbi:MAG: cytochrome P450 [Halieaceae bacterium]|nr:cytochrome P450 [Halieaceae bacterium]
MARFDEVRASLSDHETFVSSRGVGVADFAKEEPWRPPSLLLEADPPLHDRTRGIMSTILAPARLREREPLWRERAHELVDELTKIETFDAMTDLAEVFPMRIFPDAVGLMDEGREHLLTYAAAVFNAFGPRNHIFEEGNASSVEASAWVAEACKRENLKPGGWGLDIFAAADRGECTPNEAEKLVRSLLSAGVDTTVNGIGHLVLAFTEHPHEWDKLRAEPRLIRRAVDESIRWDSTVQTFFRTASRDAEVAGHLIPKDSKVLLFLASANRDPRKWDKPELFDLSRTTSGHVGFGAGIHQCLGQVIARMEAQMIVGALAERCVSIRRTAEPVRRLNNTLHALASLPVSAQLA